MSFELPTIQSFEKEASSSLLQIDELLAVCLGSTLGAVMEPLDTAKPVHVVIQELENCRKQLTFSVSEANSLITQLQSKRDAKLGDLRNILLAVQRHLKPLAKEASAKFQECTTALEVAEEQRQMVIDTLRNVKKLALRSQLVNSASHSNITTSQRIQNTHAQLSRARLEYTCAETKLSMFENRLRRLSLLLCLIEEARIADSSSQLGPSEEDQEVCHQSQFRDISKQLVLLCEGDNSETAPELVCLNEALAQLSLLASNSAFISRLCRFVEKLSGAQHAIDARIEEIVCGNWR